MAGEKKKPQKSNMLDPKGPTYIMYIILYHILSPFNVNENLYLNFVGLTVV